MVNCVYCKAQIHPRMIASSFKCDSCSGWGHKNCIPSKYSDSLLETGSFTCDSCENRDNSFVDSPTNVSFQSLDLLLQKHLSPIKNDLANIKLEFSNLTRRLDLLEAENKNLKSELQAINSNKADVKNQLSYNIDQSMNEISERMKRINNLIIIGLKESTSSVDSERKDFDKSEISNILQHLNIECTTSTPIRLGKVNSSRARPIKLKLVSEELVNSILRKSHLLKDTDKWKSVILSRDRTPMELDHLKTLKIELKERQKNGENNLKIKFFNNIPKIVQVNFSNSGN